MLTLEDLKKRLIEELNANEEEILEDEDLLQEYVDSTIPLYNRELCEVLMSDLRLGYGEIEIALEEDADIFKRIAVAIYGELGVTANEWLEGVRHEG